MTNSTRADTRADKRAAATATASRRTALPLTAFTFACAVPFMAPSIAIAEAAAIEEIVVTARKKDVNIEDAPIAVSVLSGQSFDESNIGRLDNFNGYVPGLNVSKNDGAGRVVTIRGIGWETAQNIASQPSVLSYIDGIYLANPLSFGLDLGDIERVEVYRGPQGTEFGQGTTGGAINIVTKQPDLEELGGSIDLEGGTFNTFRGRAALNVPLGETAAIRASVQRYRRDGFAEIVGGELDGFDLDDADSTTGKLAIKWQPIDQLTIGAQVFYQESDQNAAAQKHIDDPNPDPRELTQDFPGFFNLENTSASLHVTYETDSGFTFRYLAGYQNLKKEQAVDGDRLNEELTNVDLNGFGAVNNFDVLPFWNNDSEAYSQELSVAFTNNSFDWVAGVYYLDHDNVNDFLEATAPGPFSASADAIFNPSLETLPPFNSALLFNETRQVDRRDLAAYTQATWRINERYALTGGLRYSREDQRDFGEQFFGIFGGFDRDTDDSQVTWKVGLDVNVSDDHLVYGLISTGWKNGGTNPGAITNGALFLGESFEAEEVTAYEIGSRSTFLDGRLSLNLTAFYYDHENLQFIFEDPVPFGGGTGTIPETEEYGVESEFRWLITNNWSVDGALSWQDGQIKSDVFALDVADFLQALSPGVGLFTEAGFNTRLELTNNTNLNGNEPPKLPDILARLAINNDLNFSNGSTLTSRLEYVHRGKFQARVFNNSRVDDVPSYDIVNLHFNYQIQESPLSLSLSVSNLFDEDGVNNRFTNPFGLLTTSDEFIPPREVIAGIRYVFN